MSGLGVTLRVEGEVQRHRSEKVVWQSVVILVRKGNIAVYCLFGMKMCHGRVWSFRSEKVVSRCDVFSVCKGGSAWPVSVRSFWSEKVAWPSVVLLF